MSNRLSILAVKAIQEQQKIIDKVTSEKLALEQRVMNLEAQMDQLKGLVKQMMTNE